MKKNFLKIGLFLVLGITAVAFYSCDDKKTDDDGFMIKATNVVDDSERIITVKAIAYWGGDDYDGDAIAQAPYKNHGFTLELPKTVAAKYLYPISEDAPEGITISDKDANVLFLDEIGGYDEAEEDIGYFFLEKEDDYSAHYTSWFYTDRDLTIKGNFHYTEENYEDIETFDMKLKKGWNVVYDSYTETYNEETGVATFNYLITTQKPSGVTHVWTFSEYGIEYSPAKSTAKSVKRTKPVFFK